MMENWLCLGQASLYQRQYAGRHFCAEEKFTNSVNVFTLYTETQSYQLYRSSKSVASLTAYFQYIKPQWKIHLTLNLPTTTIVAQPFLMFC
jgi:hypothetical protein